MELVPVMVLVLMFLPELGYTSTDTSYHTKSDLLTFSKIPELSGLPAPAAL